jgi:cytochrome P450
MRPESARPPGPSAPALVQTWRWLRWGSSLGLLERYQRQYGDVFRVEVLGPSYRCDGRRWPLSRRTCVVYSAPETIREIFALTGDVLHAGEALAPLEGVLGRRALTLLDGAEHRDERRDMLALLSTDRLDRLEHRMVLAAARAVDRWTPGSGLDLWNLIERTVDELNHATALARHPDEVTWLRRMVHRARRGFLLRLFMQTVRGGRAEAGGRTDPSWRAVRDLVARQLHEGRARTPRAETLLLDVLLEGNPAPSEADLDVVVQRLMTLGAGMENTIAAVAWTCLHLLRNPEALERVRSEVRGDRSHVPRPDSYLEAACKESLRLHPPFPFVIRRVAQPVSIGGFELAPGTLVVASLYLLHRRPELFPEPQAFRPERFMGERVRADAYLPFGTGPRRCLGHAFAVRQIRIMLAEIFRRFDLELESVAPIRAARRTITMVPASGAARVTVRPAHAAVSG